MFFMLTVTAPPDEEDEEDEEELEEVVLGAGLLFPPEDFLLPLPHPTATSATQATSRTTIRRAVTWASPQALVSSR
jgi:hypothetical protein